MRSIDVGGYLHPLSIHSLEYLPQEMDEANDTKYYGYVSHIGSWIIQRIVTSTGVIRYKCGKQDFSTNWTGRAGLTYTYFNLSY
jgi:hypothetical protein